MILAVAPTYYWTEMPPKSPMKYLWETLRHGPPRYIPMADGSWLYLATFQDMVSRKIVGWELADNMRTELVVSA